MIKIIGLNIGKKQTRLASHVKRVMFMQVGQNVIKGNVIKYGYSVMMTFTMIAIRQIVALKSRLVLVMLDTEFILLVFVPPDLMEPSVKLSEF